jgi:hypothetical protein
VWGYKFTKAAEKTRTNINPNGTEVSTTTKSHIFAFGVGVISAESPCGVATFVENSERHIEARPSVRLCAGLITRPKLGSLD